MVQFYRAKTLLAIGSAGLMLEQKMQSLKGQVKKRPLNFNQ